MFGNAPSAPAETEASPHAGERGKLTECRRYSEFAVIGFSSSAWSREPPHIHVAQAGRYAKFWLEPVTLADVRGFRDHELTEISRIVAGNRELFLRRWHGYFGGAS